MLTSMLRYFRMKLPMVLVLSFMGTHSAMSECKNAVSMKGEKFEGTIEFRTFAGGPNFEDVRKGDRAEPGFILQLRNVICIDDDGERVLTDRIHVIPSNDNISRRLRGLVALGVTVTVSEVFSAHTAHHRAPLVAFVDTVSRGLSPQDQLEMGSLSTVQGFYHALSAGRGDEAVRFIIPEKRGTGPYVPHEISRFYGRMKSPLTLKEAIPSTNGYRVRYSYVDFNGRRCDGRADVILTKRGSLTLIERVQTLDGC